MTSDIVRQRDEIEGAIAGRTLCDELRQVAEASGDADAYADQAGDRWRSLTWEQARQRVLEVAAGFAALGLASGERVALMLPNRSEHVLAGADRRTNPHAQAQAPRHTRQVRRRHRFPLCRLTAVR